jgi:hypothetical protein
MRYWINKSEGSLYSWEKYVGCRFKFIGHRDWIACTRPLWTLEQGVDFEEISESNVRLMEL